MICSVLSKWYFHFYLSAPSDFGFFSFVGYLHPKLHIKGVKTPFLNFVGYMKSRLLSEGLLRSFQLNQIKNVKIRYVYEQGWTKINKRGGPNKGV